MTIAVALYSSVGLYIAGMSCALLCLQKLLLCYYDLLSKFQCYHNEIGELRALSSAGVLCRAGLAWLSMPGLSCHMSKQVRQFRDICEEEHTSTLEGVSS